MSLKHAALLLAAALAGAGLVLANRPSDEDVAPAPVAVAPGPLPGAARLPLAAAQPMAPACKNAERMAGWQLLSAGAGGYREAGFAVLHHAQRGTVTVAEGTAFDQGLVLLRVLADGVQLGCGRSAINLALPLANGAAPAMRSALPDPERSASN